MKSVCISIVASVFQAKIVPEQGKIVGYAALINHLQLQMPYPMQFALVSNGNKKYQNEDWQIFPVIYQPEENIQKHLQFALKYEGINLLFFKKWFEQGMEQCLVDWIEQEPTSIYNRQVWFLYEFLTQKLLPISDADKKIKFTSLINESLQFSLPEGSKSKRHRIINNLPGNVNFCPLIYKTQKLQDYLDQDLDAKNNVQMTTIRKDILLRTSAFLLLKDSKASFTIEGENPIPSRAMRWGKAIGEAGRIDLTKQELERLQQIVIESSKFTKFGYRQEEGFVGEHDRETFAPLPDHISAKHSDIELLMNGLLQTAHHQTTQHYHPVLSAATIAFGFVFIHPFVDGNGRLHRYIIHHILAKTNFTPQGIVFPVSASILHHIVDYRMLLEKYSHSILPFIQWNTTADNNVAVLNDTADYYKYYDATAQAEFLFDCINDTITNIIPQEVKYLQQYDEFKSYLDNTFEMPDKMVAFLVKLLSQNDGQLSKNKRESDFKSLSEAEINDIETRYKNVFINE